ncbi:MAG: hypothetical protein VX700_02855 [Pseudomonadota bacterium]|nr:hypothetical protein [Pseudomonadota bacterium]
MGPGFDCFRLARDACKYTHAADPHGPSGPWGGGQTLVKVGAPLDHINNLPWTALIQSIVLGDVGPNYIACLKALVDAGANVNIPDGSGVSPL